jgi:hypothetical protein
MFPFGNISKILFSSTMMLEFKSSYSTILFHFLLAMHTYESKRTSTSALGLNA